MSKNYLKIIEHYESCLEKHGDSHLGVDWPNEKDMFKRYNVMLDVIKSAGPVSLLDFGCGTAGLYDYILSKGISDIKYLGLEISHEFLKYGKQKHPDVDFYELDVLSNELTFPDVDYVVMNGVFTEKRDLSQTEMFEYLIKVIKTVFPKVKKGLAFNVMSKNVDWEREDLFHVSKDLLEKELSKEVSRNIVFRADYGLYEFTAYVYRESNE